MSLAGHGRPFQSLRFGIRVVASPGCSCDSALARSNDGLLFQSKFEILGFSGQNLKSFLELVLTLKTMTLRSEFKHIVLEP